MMAVREALGLSIDDAAALIEQPSGVVQDMDTQPIETLARLYDIINAKGGEVILQLKNPDDSTFREWKVTPGGYVVEFDRKAPDAA